MASVSATPFFVAFVIFVVNLLSRRQDHGVSNANLPHGVRTFEFVGYSWYGSAR